MLAPVASQAQEPSESDWTSSCVSAGTGLCELTKEIRQGDIVAASVSVLHARGDLWLQYLVPVGIGIEQGVSVAVDDGEPHATRLTNCTAAGCVGHMILSDGLLTEMKKGAKINLAFSSASHHDSFTISFSLTGFSTAFGGFYRWPG